MSINIDERLQGLLNNAGKAKDAKVAIVNIKDTQLMFFLKTYYPEIWDEFKQWKFYMVHGEGAKASTQPHYQEEQDEYDAKREVVSNQCIIQKSEKE